MNRIRKHFLLSERLNRVWHCGRYGRVASLSPGWAVINHLVPSRLFNYDTFLEGVDPLVLRERLAHLAREDRRSLLWLGEPPQDPAYILDRVHSYRVLMAQSAPRVAHHQFEVHWLGTSRPPGLAELFAEAHEEPKSLPYFQQLVADPGVVVISTKAGACVLRPNFGVMGGYELAVLPTMRGRGYGTTLMGAFATVGTQTGLPVVVHVEPGRAAEKASEKLQVFQFVYEDNFYHARSA